MDEKESIKLLENLKDACYYGAVAIRYKDDGWKARDAILTLSKEKDAEIKTLSQTKERAIQMLTAYQRKFGIDIFSICPTCGGAGGFEWDNGEGDCGGEDCKDCFNGIVEKQGGEK